MTSKKTEEELMIAYQNGSQPSFQELYERTNLRVYSYLSKRLNNKEAVSDLCQDVYLKLHKSKHLYKKELKFLPWLFTITYTVLMDHFRSQKIESVEFLETDANLILLQPAEQSTIPEFNLSTNNNISDKQKEILRLRYEDEKTFAEIATIFNTSQLNIRKIISRTIEKLKNSLNDRNKSNV